MKKRKTAGEMSLKALSDKSKYDPLEIGHALTDDVYQQLEICAKKHDKIFNEEEYCIGLIVASDPLIKGIRRHKYFAFLYLPQPRPQQSVFLYNKKTQKFRRLWSLPDAKTMAIISEMTHVAPIWRNTKSWCDAFFSRDFFKFIRCQHNISLLSESEYLQANREKLIKSGCKEVDTLSADPFDFSKITIKNIVNSDTTSVD